MKEMETDVGANEFIIWSSLKMSKKGDLIQRVDDLFIQIMEDGNTSGLQKARQTWINADEAEKKWITWCDSREELKKRITEIVDRCARKKIGNGYALHGSTQLGGIQFWAD